MPDAFWPRNCLSKRQSKLSDYGEKFEAATNLSELQNKIFN